MKSKHSLSFLADTLWAINIILTFEISLLKDIQLTSIIPHECLCRENTAIDELLAEIESAIVIRKTLNNNLERLSEEARVHYKKAENFQETKITSKH